MKYLLLDALFVIFLAACGGGGSSGNVSLKGTLLPPNGPNEPSGYTLITNRPFSALNELGWSDTSYITNGLTITTDSTAPVSPPYVGQMYFPSGYAAGNAPGVAVYGMSSLSYTQVYVSFYVKLSSSWQPQEADINKVGYIWINNEPSVILLYYGSSFPVAPIIALQNVPTGSVQLSQNVGTATLANDNAWHHWEVQLIGNTPGTGNGTVNWWFDGIAQGAYTNIEFVAVNQPNTWQYLYWEPVWGGAGGTVSAAMYMWCDNYYASGAP